MFLTEREMLIHENYLKKEDTEHYINDEEDRELEIDLDYTEYVSFDIYNSDEPLDLSLKKPSSPCNILTDRPELPKFEIKANFNFAELVEKCETSKTEKKGTSTVSEKEIARLLDPHVKTVNTKFACKVCDMKFTSKYKALTHVENKHVTCLQYKCPLCRTSKGTRLSYESHLRRGHQAKVKDHSPTVRVRGHFSVQTEEQNNEQDSQSGQGYDLQFVTFLRHVLNLGQNTAPSWRGNTIAEWIDQEQGIFRINNKGEFTRRWCDFKGLDHSSWESLNSSVISQFITKNIFKELSCDDLVFQVFSIKQLLQ